MPLPVQVMFDEVYDLLDDYPPVSPPARYPTDDMVRHYLNMGQFAMYPRIYRMVLAGTTALDGLAEYVWDPELAYGRLTYIEAGVVYQGGEMTYVMVPDESYDVHHAAEGRNVVKVRPDYQSQLSSANLRVTVTMPLAPIVAAATTPYDEQVYTGPDYSIEGPPLYAMSRIMSRGLHRRLDYGRVSVEYQNRSAMPNELMSAAVFFLDEFERRVDQWRTVQPQSLQ